MAHSDIIWWYDKYSDLRVYKFVYTTSDHIVRVLFWVCLKFTNPCVRGFVPLVWGLSQSLFYSYPGLNYFGQFSKTLLFGNCFRVNTSLLHGFNIFSVRLFVVSWYIGRFLFNLQLVHVCRRAFCLLRFRGGTILVSTRNHCIGIDLTVSKISLVIVFNWTSILFICVLFIHTGAQYSKTEYTRVSIDVRSMFTSML